MIHKGTSLLLNVRNSSFKIHDAQYEMWKVTKADANSKNPAKMSNEVAQFE